MKDAVVLVTGSSRGGIGTATARIAAARGAKVVVHGHIEDQELKDIAEELQCEYIACDAADKTAVDEAVAQVVQKLGRIDVLINCAGMAEAAAFGQSDDDHWLRVYQVNVLGTVHFIQAVVPHMQEAEKGRIVNISSIRGHENMASNRITAYSASKAAIINLTSSLAKEYAPNIAVNAVSPGFTLTRMSKGWNDTVHAQVKTALIGRAAQPEEIAEAVIFLASDQASFITGQTLIVDGGYGIAGK